MTREKLLSNFSINKYADEGDSRFLWVTIDVLHTGQNLNGSYFSKEIVNKYVNTIKNTPILGFVENEDFKGHESGMEVSENENGVKVLKDVYYGKALGVIPESCNPRWVTKFSDGIEREYLRVDGIMWSKISDGYDIMNRDLFKGQSMELDFSSYEGYFDEDDDTFYFSSFKFNGCCILGDNVKPAMVDSIISVKFSKDELNDEMLAELNNKLNSFTQVNTDFREGGSDNMERGNTAGSTPATGTTATNVGGTTAPNIGNAGVDNVTNDSNMAGAGRAMGDIGNAGTSDNANAEVLGDLNSLDNSHEDSISVGSEGLKEVGEEKEEQDSEKDNSEKEEESKEEPKEEKEEVKTEISAEDFKALMDKYKELEEAFNDIKPEHERLKKEENERKEFELSAEKDKVISQFESHLSDNEKFNEIKDKKSELSIEDIKNQLSILYAEKSLGEFSVNKEEVDSVALIEDTAKTPNVVKTSKYGNISVRKNRY